MKYDQEYIYTLLLRKQLGDLSEVEDKLLQKIIKADEQVRKCWLEQEEAILYTNSEFLNDLRVESDWYKVAAVLSPKPFHVRAFRSIKRHGTAVVMLVVLSAIGGGILLLQKKNQFHQQTGLVYRSKAVPLIALGTAFNINSYDANVITTSLVTGSVITDVGDSIDVTLKPGFEAIYRPGERFRVKRFEEDVTLGWRDGIYRFRNKPLEVLAPIMMRWFGLRLQFATPAIARQTFSGELDKDRQVKIFLEEICLEAGLDYQIYDGVVHFTAQKP